MDLRFDENFVEEAVSLCARGNRNGVPPLQVVRFQRERERLYSIPDPDDRNAAFFRLHLEWFREWGLEERLCCVVREFPLVAASLEVLAFRKALGRADEGAELYVNADRRRNGVIALRVDRFSDEAGLGGLLRHELMHVHDMIDPLFGYSKRIPGTNSGQQRLVRERYRLLWDVTIDGRLLNAGRATSGSRELRSTEFNRGYSFWPAERRLTVFESLWNGLAPRHEELLLLASAPHHTDSTHKPLPGAHCPLCGFNTFRWADVSNLGNGIAETIHAEFPEWNPALGVCLRCVEVYESARDLPLLPLPG